MSDFIHKFIPAAGSDRTVLLLHEEGADENDLIPIGRAVARGAALLSPRLRVMGEAAGHAREMAEFVAWSVEHYGFAPERVYGLGYASGADLAATLMLLYPGALAGAILLRAGLRYPAVEPPDLKGSPVLMLAGQHDVIATPADAEKLAQTLTSAGAQVEVHWMNEGHELGPDDFQTAAKWIRER